MSAPPDYPVALLVVSFVALAASAWLGMAVARQRKALDTTSREDFNLVLASTLTLLGLIIGFSFSMALSRYDKRIDLEEEEANAIGTQVLRADLLAPADTARLRQLLSQYVGLRIAYYASNGGAELDAINAKTGKLQAEMWDAVRTAIAGQANPVIALVATGMTDVINAQGYAQAAWSNRIPGAAWALMAAMALTSTALVGFIAQHRNASRALMLVLPFVVALAFFLIADIESPRSGTIRVAPQNLLTVEQSLRAP